MLEELSPYLILAASGMSMIGIPILISLAVNLHDARVKSLERHTFKSVRDEFAAMKELHSVEIDQLRARIQELEKSRTEPTITEVTAQAKVIETIGRELRQVKFFIGSKRGLKFFKEIKNYLSRYSDFSEATGFSVLFTEYERSLRRQREILERSSIEE